jgi:hypothetical protein
MSSGLSWIRILLLILLMLLLLWLLRQCGVISPQAQGKKVFVSSQLFDGNFGAGQKLVGHPLADQRCQALAQQAGRSGSYMAWISGRVDTGAGPLPHGVVHRFAQSAGPYVLVDGTKVADNWADLTDGSLDHAIDLTEQGTPVGAEARVWTNTTTGGQAWDNARQCAAGISSDEAGGMWTWSCGAPGWTAGDCRFQSGKYGDAHASSGSWTGTVNSNTGCDQALRLYCFEQ